MVAGLAIAVTSLFKEPSLQVVSAASAAGFEQISVQSPLVGKPAPDFRLADAFGNLVTLDDLRGDPARPVVLFMSGGGGCGTCLAQIVKLNESSVFTDGSIGVASVVSNHTDPPSAWQGFLGDNPQYAKLALLIDQDGAAIKAYGAGQLPSGMGHGGGQIPGHSYFIIDREGIVRVVADDQTMGDWTATLEAYVKAL